MLQLVVMKLFENFKLYVNKQEHLNTYKQEFVRNTLKFRNVGDKKKSNRMYYYNFFMFFFHLFATAQQTIWQILNKINVFSLLLASYKQSTFREWI